MNGWNRWPLIWREPAVGRALGAALGLWLLCVLFVPLPASASTDAPAVRQDENGVAEAAAAAATSQTQQIEIPAPLGSGFFGGQLYVLANGNFVITDPEFDDGNGGGGMVYLYDGATNAQISALRVSRFGDINWRTDVEPLPNGDYVVYNYLWDSATTANVGAVRLCSGVTGCSGTINSTNSLVGSTAEDQVGSNGITPLPNGAYVVNSRLWDNGATNAGAITWCPANGCTGPVSAANSLVGSSTNDQVGFNGVNVLKSGNYVVGSSTWDSGAMPDAGAATWCSGTSGCMGTITNGNSLVGSQANDKVSSSGVVAITQGRYVVLSPNWANGAAAIAGAVTPCNGNGGCTGTVSGSNSLVGTGADNLVGWGRVTLLANGGYVVSSPYWDSNTTADVGAVTFCPAASPCSGNVTSANSLVGSSLSDIVGTSVLALPNGNYVVSSTQWNNGAIANAGAATWCSGVTGCVGAVSTSNSLAGGTANDLIGSDHLTLLADGNYLVGSTVWDNGALSNVGAVTWCSGATGCAPGPLSAGNSLIGANPLDSVGYAVALVNGGYVVPVENWDDGATADVGLVIPCLAPGGCTGIIVPGSNLRGSSTNDSVGSEITALSNGNYVVGSSAWNSAAAPFAGAATWCNRTAPCTGVVSIANSLTGSHENDQVGDYENSALPNGLYVVFSPFWGDGVRTQLGALSLGDGRMGTTGIVSTTNSVLGNTEGEGTAIFYAFNSVHNNLIVGLPFDKRVVLMTLAFPLNVEFIGTGKGSVQSTPPGLTCGTTACTGTFNESTVMTLTATSDVSSNFEGWKGACTGTGTCVVTMDRAQQVRAQFALKQLQVTLPASVPGGQIVVTDVRRRQARQTPPAPRPPIPTARCCASQPCPIRATSSAPGPAT